jgi:hypothetical protein
MKFEESMVGEIRNWQEHVPNRREQILRLKNEILMKIPELKRSGIKIIAELCGILTGFPNQVGH